MVDFLNEVYPEPDADAGQRATIRKNRTEKIFKRLQRERMKTGTLSLIPLSRFLLGKRTTPSKGSTSGMLHGVKASRVNLTAS